MQFSAYTFSCSFTSDAFVPGFLGSILRNALGHHLKRLTCALKTQNCNECPLNTSCIYAIIFEGYIQPNTASKRTEHPPLCYTLVPPSKKMDRYSPGDAFSFQIKLFGSTTQYFPHIFYAVKEMGKNGIGKAIREGFGRFEIKCIEHNGEQIFTGSSLNNTISPYELHPESLASKDQDLSSLTIKFVTPLRTKQQSALVVGSHIKFDLLIRTALRRCSVLETTYGKGEPTFNAQSMLKDAGAININGGSTQWFTFKLYSKQQKQTMKFGGVIGSTTYTGKNLDQFIPLLKYCEYVHLGKQSSFGLGQIEIENNI